MQLKELKGLGPKKAAALAHKNIFTPEDLLRVFPVEYEDHRQIHPLATLAEGKPALVKGQVVKIQPSFPGRRGKRVLRVTLSDGTGEVDLVFFNNGYLGKTLQGQPTLWCYGTPQRYGNRLQMVHPSFSKDPGEGEKGLVPVYPLIRGLTHRDLRSYMAQLVDHPGFEEVWAKDILPQDFLQEFGLLSKAVALRCVHFPQSPEELQEGRRRFLYQDMLLLQLGLALMEAPKQAGRALPKDGVEDLYIQSLPFPLTKAQERTVKDVLQDMESPYAMNRLVQGDVGSGKTAVAEIALFKAAKNGLQGAFMMPTELLAIQQFEGLKQRFEPFGIQVGLLVGSLSQGEKRQVQQALAEGTLQVVVGTHALIQEAVTYHNLGLVITDEQHRFGVKQRTKIKDKGQGPHCLVMRATPIPRTLAMILFGDMDISLIDELPQGRKTIQTKAVTGKVRDQVYSFVLGEIQQHHQVYVVAPLIEESEALENVRSVTTIFQDLTQRFPDFEVGLLHGAMAPGEKEEIMKAFAQGQIHILVSTVVIEVGINVPNATVMVLENAERFGLSQMHQLRGRVGRGDQQSYCILITENLSETALARAKIMTQTNDGFVIAEKDLALRGPGEMFGSRQHGVPSAHLYQLFHHQDVYQEVEEAAHRILQQHPGLEDPQTAALRQAVEQVFDREAGNTL